MSKSFAAALLGRAPAVAGAVALSMGFQNPDADDLARQIADLHARNFRCGKDKPIVLGDTAPGFSKPHGEDDE